MPAEYRIDRDRHLVLSRAFGVLSGLELITHQERLGADSAFDPSMNQLYDLTRVSELLDVETTTIRHLARCNPFSGSGQRAIVSGDDLVFGMARMFEMLAKVSVDSEEIRVFRTVDDAAKWLGLELPASAQAWVVG